jgi:CheY-like chemotaxis protein/HD-like signal output (HDOD) protein
MILVVDDMAVIREPIAACLQLAGFTTQCAADGAEALDAVRKSRPDLILLDLSMPGMDGMTFLRHLRADSGLAKIPVFLLTAVSDKNLVLQAAKLGIKEYLLKSRFSSGDLVARVKKHVEGAPSKAAANAGAAPISAQANQPAASTGETCPCAGPARPAKGQPSVGMPAASDRLSAIPRLLDKERCLARITETVQTKTLSGVVTQVMKLASSPRGDMAELAALIGRDSLLSARVLGTANSAAYLSTRGAIKTVAEAVRQIGSTTVRNITAACGIFDVMPRSGIDGFNPVYCWQHSFAVAQLCELLEQPQGPEAASVGYVVGLCHDLAEILLRLNFDAEYKQIQQFHLSTGTPVDEVELHMLGTTRPELIAATIQSLRLPDAIRGPIEAFHGSTSPVTGSAARLLTVLRLAEQYANGLQLVSSVEATVAPVSRSDCKLLFKDAEPPRPIGEEFRAQIVGLTAVLARLPSSEEAQLLRPLYPKSAVRLVLVRDPTLTPFDPIQAALESLAEVEVCNALPGPASLKQCQAVLVTARTSSALHQQDLIALQSALIAGPDSVLALVGRTEPAAQAPFPIVQWPIPLERLVQWVDRLSKPQLSNAHQGK